MENLSNLTPRMLASYFDHTLLRPEATPDQIERLCEEATRAGCLAVCVNPSMLPVAQAALDGSEVLPITVIGFPLGAVPLNWKVDEARRALDLGAREIDMVINIGRYVYTPGSGSALADEISAVCDVLKTHGVPLKVIIETALLSPAQIKNASRIIANSGAEFVKTSTGFASRGASLEDLNLIAEGIRESRNPATQIKASGGIKSLDQALAMIKAGASRIGSSNTLSIIAELSGRK
jgi:deoxyribose-phosphate aldolase